VGSVLDCSRHVIQRDKRNTIYVKKNIGETQISNAQRISVFSRDKTVMFTLKQPMKADRAVLFLQLLC